MKIKTTGALSAVLFPMLIASSAVWAAPAHQFMVSGLAIKITPADENDPVISDQIGQVPGMDFSVSSKTLPAIGLSYWVHDNIVLETYFSTPSTHDISMTGFEAYGLSKVVSADMMPLTVFAHYLHQIPDTRFTLTAGAGLVYAIFRNIEVDAQVSQLDPTLQFDVDNTLGAALQVGAYVDITPEIVARFSYSKMLFDADARIKTSIPGLGNLTTSVTVDPDVLMVGLGYKF